MNDAYLKKGTWMLMGLFTGLCLLHYFSQRPLWLDENLILENISSSSYLQLFAPLKNSQAFPRIYLILVKFLAEVFNDHVLALRLLPLVFMTAAYLCWVRIYQYNIKDLKIFLLALLSFACAYRLSYYGAELKPYSMDVLAIALHALYVNEQRRLVQDDATKVLWVGAALLPITLFFSYAAIFIGWIAGVNFVLLARNNPKLRLITLVHIIGLMLCLMIFYQIDFKHSFGDQGLHHYWQSYFVQTDSPLNFFDSLFEGIKRIVVYWYGTEKWHYRLAVPFIPFFLYALFRYGIKYIREDGFKIWRLESLMLVLFGELFMLGICKFYPFTGERITLFLAPFVFYLILKGMDDLGQVKVGGGILRMSFLTYYGAFCLMCLMNTLTIYLKLYK